MWLIDVALYGLASQNLAEINEEMILSQSSDGEAIDALIWMRDENVNDEEQEEEERLSQQECNDILYAWPNVYAAQSLTNQSNSTESLKRWSVKQLRRLKLPRRQVQVKVLRLQQMW